MLNLQILFSVYIVPEVDGRWAHWEGWSTCTVTCGSGIQSRSRLCSDPEPRFQGKTCHGKTIDERKCGTGICPGRTMWFVCPCLVAFTIIQLT